MIKGNGRNDMNTQLENISKAWPSVRAIFSVPHSEKEYQYLVEILDNLVDEISENERHELSAVMETVGNLIEIYEDRHYMINQESPIECLKYLMQEHGLKQSDLIEVGSQGVVSEILAGKRALNIEQVKKISKRFGVSPEVFI